MSKWIFKLIKNIFYRLRPLILFILCGLAFIVLMQMQYAHLALTPRNFFDTANRCFQAAQHHEQPVNHYQPTSIHRTVYFYVNTHGHDQSTLPYWHEAVQGWNKTNVVTLQPTNDIAAATITLVPQSISLSQNTVGLTNTQSSLTTQQINGRYQYRNHNISQCELDLKKMKTYGYTKQEIVNVAEHELGHALGLKHSQAVRSVMSADNRFFNIQQTDADHLADIFSKTTPNHPVNQSISCHIAGS